MTAFLGRTLSWDLRERVLEVRLHRAPCNEIGLQTLEELERLVDHLVGGGGGARAVLIHSGLESGFCAGADLRALHAGLKERREQGAPARALRVARRVATRLGIHRGEELAGRAAERVHRALVRQAIGGFIDRIHRVFDSLDTLPLPTIAAVHGPVFGGGFELALTCDLVVADKSARFCFPELRLGILPGFGGIPRLERDVGNAVVRDLLLTGRSLGASRAHELGLVSQVVPRGRALEVARRVARQPLRFDPEVLGPVKQFAKPLPARRLAEERRRFVRLVAEPRVAEALDDFVHRTDARPYLP